MLRVTMTATRQAQRLMRKGGRPMTSDSVTIFRRSFMMPRLRWIMSFLLEKRWSCQSSMMSCERMVAAAAPRMPQWNTKMKSGANTQLSTTVPNVAYMALRGRLVERSRALRPR